jgi:hypothetical protein
MTGQEALRIVDRLLEHHRQPTLKDVQRSIVIRVLERQSYQSIAKELDYETDYIKHVAAQLWKSISQLVGEKTTKGNIEAILHRYRAVCPVADWGEAIDVAKFYGREDELATLTDLVLSGCRLVGIFGLGGVGKTALSVKLAQKLESEFQCVIWRSLRNLPTPTDLLNEILSILVGVEVQESSIALLMKQLRTKRCLLVLDRVESILAPGEHSGKYIAGYEAYQQIFDCIADLRHQSCLVLTGREKPHNITLREGVNLPVRSIELTGLSTGAAQNILADKGISGSIDRQQTLISYLRGNPLAIKISATAIQNLFARDIQAFIAQGMIIFGSLWELLEGQFDRLSTVQQDVMYWLAIHRAGVIPARLQGELLPLVALPRLLEVLEILRDRSLIETTDRGLTQQPVIMEYVTERFINSIEQEILTGELHLLRTHALIEIQTKDYLVDDQNQLILQQLADRLISHFTTRVQLEAELWQLLKTFQDRSPAETGYAGKNLLNLFCHLKINLNGCDLSQIFIRQTDLLYAPVDFIWLSENRLLADGELAEVVKLV